MRAYFFGNMYLSSIQQGIQALHVVSEMFVKYSDPNKPNYHPVHEWATDHKTVVLLNAGYGSELYKLYGLFDDSNNPYPWAHFHESEDALDNAFTSIGIILPERIYETSKICREEGWSPFLLREGILGESKGLPTDLSDWECELVLTINRYGLAK